jgi:RimJ/RimL family protein N-acetyltransferase
MNHPPSNIFPETERMHFRQFTDADAPLLFELDGDPEVMRFISKGKPTPPAKIQNEIIPKFLNYYRKLPPQGFWAAHLRSGGDFIGWFHLRPGTLNETEMELGYRLKRNAWGRGLATEGSRALLAKAFNAWGHDKVSAHTMADNAASRRVMQKLGLKFGSDFITKRTCSMAGWNKATGRPSNTQLRARIIPVPTRQPDRDRRQLIGFGNKLDVSVVRQRNPLRDAQTQAAALDGAGMAVVPAEEPFENARL